MEPFFVPRSYRINYACKAHGTSALISFGTLVLVTSSENSPKGSGYQPQI
jgi:hypothetical protein